VVVATRYGTGLRSGSFTIRVWRPSYARLGGMINGRIAYVGNRFAPAGPYNLRAFQTVQYTRFLPGQASLASLRRGEAVAVLPMSNNLRVARAVQMSFRQNLALAPRVQ